MQNAALLFPVVFKTSFSYGIRYKQTKISIIDPDFHPNFVLIVW